MTALESETNEFSSRYFAAIRGLETAQGSNFSGALARAQEEYNTAKILFYMGEEAAHAARARNRERKERLALTWRG